jgi:hypothetical protein
MSPRPTDRLAARLQSRLAGADAESGMTTAEYAMGTVAVAGCGGVLYKVITSPQVLEVIKKVIIHAFKLF